MKYHIVKSPVLLGLVMRLQQECNSIDIIARFGTPPACNNVLVYTEYSEDLKTNTIYIQEDVFELLAKKESLKSFGLIDKNEIPKEASIAVKI